MPPPSNEQDLKRRARRRLIGAVALTLLAVIVLPLLLEDEPPPASSLAVKMAALPAPTAPAQGREAEPAPAVESGLDKPVAEPQPESKPEPAQAAPPSRPQAAKHEPVKPAPVQPVARPEAAKPAPHVEPKPAADAAFVVQLAALSDAAKARALAARASQAGLPAYTDVAGKLTRVRLGPYATREAAVAAAVKLAEHGMSGQVVAK